MFQNNHAHRLLVVVFLLVAMLVGLKMVRRLFNVKVMAQLVVDGLLLNDVRNHAI